MGLGSAPRLLQKEGGTLGSFQGGMTSSTQPGLDEDGNTFPQHLRLFTNATNQQHHFCPVHGRFDTLIITWYPSPFSHC